MKSEVSTVEEYLNSMPDDRRKSIEAVRNVVLNNLKDGFEEVYQYGMISYIIPFSEYPNTYNKQPLALLSLGNQKNHMSLYLNNIYSDPKLNEWFVDAYRSSGKKLNMGKSCVRFKKLENLPLDVIGEAVSRTTVKQFIDMYENAKISSKRSKR